MKATHTSVRCLGLFIAGYFMTHHQPSSSAPLLPRLPSAGPLCSVSLARHWWAPRWRTRASSPYWTLPWSTYPTPQRSKTMPSWMTSECGVSYSMELIWMFIISSVWREKICLMLMLCWCVWYVLMSQGIQRKLKVSDEPYERSYTPFCWAGLQIRGEAEWSESPAHSTLNMLRTNHHQHGLS